MTDEEMQGYKDRVRASRTERSEGSLKRDVRDRCECTVGTGQQCQEKATRTIHPRDGTRTYQVCETHGVSAMNNGWDVRAIPNPATQRPGFEETNRSKKP